MYQFCVCCSSIYNLYMYIHKTSRNRLIGYLIFISVNWNLETTDRLTGYSVKVHSTSMYVCILCMYVCMCMYMSSCYVVTFTNCSLPPGRKRYVNCLD